MSTLDGVLAFYQGALAHHNYSEICMKSMLKITSAFLLMVSGAAFAAGQTAALGSAKAPTAATTTITPTTAAATTTATPMNETSAQKSAAKTQIKADEKSALAACKKMSGAEKSACKKQAKAQEKTAMADLKAKK